MAGARSLGECVLGYSTSALRSVCSIIYSITDQNCNMDYYLSCHNWARNYSWLVFATARINEVHFNVTKVIIDYGHIDLTLPASL